MGKAWKISSCEWHQVDARWMWGGLTAKQCTGSSIWELNCSFGLQMLAWSKLLILTSKKLAFKFSMYIFEYRPLPPYTSSTLLPLMWWVLPGIPCFSSESNTPYSLILHPLGTLRAFENQVYRILSKIADTLIVRTPQLWIFHLSN